MDYLESNIISKFAHYGILHREALKNDQLLLKKLLRMGLVMKVHKKGRTFYELTEKSLILLEHQRRKLVEEAQMNALLEPRSDFYKALLDNLRFFDEKNSAAEEFLFLGDWQLTQPVLPSQLELSKLRFYKEKVTPRKRHQEKI